jgi:hypothetical protein
MAAPAALAQQHRPIPRGPPRPGVVPMPTAQPADLSIRLERDGSKVDEGERYSYTRVSNNGPGTARGVTVIVSTHVFVDGLGIDPDPSNNTDRQRVNVQENETDEPGPNVEFFNQEFVIGFP